MTTTTIILLANSFAQLFAALAQFMLAMRGRR